MFILIVETLHEYWFFLYVNFTRLFYVKDKFKLQFKNLFYDVLVIYREGEPFTV